jgi:hypothetical protein
MIAPAAVEATPDNVESYRVAIERLIDDQDFFAERVNAGAALRLEFFDPERAWTARAYEMIVGRN